MITYLQTNVLESHQAGRVPQAWAPYSDQDTRTHRTVQSPPHGQLETCSQFPSNIIISASKLISSQGLGQYRHCIECQVAFTYDKERHHRDDRRCYHEKGPGSVKYFLSAVSPTLSLCMSAVLRTQLSA